MTRTDKHDFLARGFLYTSQSALSFLISNFCRQISLSWKTAGKGKQSVHYGYRQVINEYITSDMMEITV